MINHFRTVLGNQPPGYQPTIQGGEYIADEFRPLDLLGELAGTLDSAIWRALFGSQPDPVSINYALRRYLTLLHQPVALCFPERIQEQVSYLDRQGRPCWQNSVSNLPFQMILGPQVDTRLTVAKPSQLDQVTGWAQSHWLITVESPTQVRIKNLRRGGEEVLSGAQLQVLTGGKALIELDLGMMVLLDLVPGASWELETVAFPTYSLATALGRLDALLPPQSDACREFFSDVRQDQEHALRLGLEANWLRQGTWERSPTLDRLMAVLVQLAINLEKRRHV